ncbi:hypothetical protein SAMD00019534_029310 [Acytostelium subglobosum LB1]|uniref:hypothetical protein n=1 Tax=Acytostelium subglobosum LB1 TaxID=1410327 RepID=UPI000644F862|nr:hypothetical protein SAMD00019534_029310 [Acytostelium subglobosum LB1]GAM19756.1 hypothetical protein SAMD00019534_029310 [Acytostelium subglobosum LB1]|eukprot:XP_012756518.1 hypothetical protein SAMD00019534_029310 [Acytostelium subglobosum LB1]
MSNNNKIMRFSIVAATVVLLLATIAMAQQTTFTPRVFKLANAPASTGYETAVLVDKKGFVLSAERLVDIYPESIAENVTSEALITPTPFQNRFARDTIPFWSSAAVGSTVYSITSTSILGANLTEPQSFGSQSTSGAISSAGVFTYNSGTDTKVFIVDSSGQKVHYFVDRPNNVEDGNVTVAVSSVPITGLSLNQWGFAADTDNGLLFIGDDVGSVVTFNLKTMTPFGASTVYRNTNVTNRFVATVDPIRKLVFFAANDNDQLSMDVLQYQVPFTGLSANYTKTLTRMSSCNAAVYDKIQGQVFFIGADDSGLAVIGEGFRDGLRSNFISFFTDQPASVESTAIGVSINLAKHQLTIFTSKQYVELHYESNCEANCNGNGDCLMGVCSCNSEYIGATCDNKLCLGDLNNCTSGLHGTCKNGICECDPVYQTVANCSVLGCYMNCSNRGECNFDSVSSNYTCKCPADFVGAYCQESAPAPQCNTIGSRSDCISRTYCGWCASSKTCQAGNQYGPAVGFCREWFFAEDYEVGVIVLACIFIALISILFLIDMITTIPLDLQRAKNYEVEFRTGTYPKPSHEEASVLWWRDQRSAKAWTLMDQFQFLSLVSHMGVVFPSRFLSFTMFLDWTNLGIPFPQSIRDQMPPMNFEWRDTYDQIANTGRNLATYAQYNNILESSSTYHLANILFWFIILAAAFIVPLLIAFIILSFVESLVHWKEVIRNRLVHCTVRILQFSYIGVISAAAFSIVAKPIAAKTLVPGIILIVLYGIGYPVAIWFILRVPESRLHNPSFKQQFGSLYVNFKPKTDHRFVVFSYIKRFIMAMIIGILAFDIEPAYPLAGTDRAVPIAQCAIISLVLLLYAVLLFIRKPYFDHYHLWLEYALAVINIVSICVCLTHLKEPSQAGELVFCILQALGMVVCIATFVISWLQMRSKFLTKITSCFSCCGGGSSKTVDHEMTGHRK